MPLNEKRTCSNRVHQDLAGELNAYFFQIGDHLHYSADSVWLYKMRLDMGRFCAIPEVVHVRPQPPLMILILFLVSCKVGRVSC